MTPLSFPSGLTLVGGGEARPEDLALARPLAPGLAAADGGADWLAAQGETPDAIIGDMDSLSMPPPENARFIEVQEQDSTDLEKCLRLTDAPFYIGVGFTGGRLDHTLAAFHALVAPPRKRLFLIGPEDIAFAAPPIWRARLAVGARVSIFPVAPVRMLGSSGLRWPLEGLAMAAGTRIGTSNAASAADVEIRLEGRGAVILLERRFLGAAVESITGAGR